MSLLSACSLFNRLPGVELQLLESAARMSQVPDGTAVFQEGDPGDGLYVISRGDIQISTLVSGNDRRVLTQYGPSQFFGEMAVIDSQPRSATATSLGETELAFLPSMDVWLALERSPILAVNLMREVVHRMRDFNVTYTREVVQAERLALVGRFARSIVHDFKNPLNIIGISADMAAMENASVDMRLTARGRIRRQVDRLTNMISELLEFTRGPSTTVVLANQDYGTFVKTLLEEVAVEVQPRNVEIVQESDPPLATVAMDPRRLSHVLHNLVNNACDAMSGGGTIHVRVELQDGQVVTELRDSGPGIAPEIASRLFEAFATYGKANGTGLGLSICRRILEDHHGKIEAMNAPQGGALFRFTLPVVSQAPSA